MYPCALLVDMTAAWKTAVWSGIHVATKVVWVVQKCGGRCVPAVEDNVATIVSLLWKRNVKCVIIHKEEIKQDENQVFVSGNKCYVVYSIKEIK